MTDDRKLKEAIRARQVQTGESYMEARRQVLAVHERDQGADVAAAVPPSSATASRPGRGPISLEDLNDDIIHTPPDQERLVPSVDPECGPYSRFICVPKAEVDARCRSGYRRITGYEVDTMIGEPEDYTEDWKHSDW